MIQTPAFHRYYARVLLGQARARYGTPFAEILLRGAMRARVKSHRPPPAQPDLFAPTKAPSQGEVVARG